MLEGHERNISIINVHTPTEEKDETDKDIFYEKLVEEYEKLPKHDTEMVMGDYIAKVRKEEIYRLTVGMNSKHEEINNNGQRVITFWDGKNTVIKSTQP